MLAISRISKQPPGLSRKRLGPPGIVLVPARNLHFYSLHILFSGHHPSLHPSVPPSSGAAIQLGPAHNTLQTPMTTYFDTLSKVRPHPFHPPHPPCTRGNGLIRLVVVRRRPDRWRRRYRTIPRGFERCSQDVRYAFSILCLCAYPSLPPHRCATDILGSTAFAPVKTDLSGNIEKIRTRLTAHPDNSKTLEGLLEAEVAEKVTTATQALLWLLRGLKFTMIALQLNQADSTQELSASFTKAYEGTLKQYHNFIVKGIFAVSIFSFGFYALPICCPPKGNGSRMHCPEDKLMNY